MLPVHFSCLQQVEIRVAPEQQILRRRINGKRKVTDLVADGKGSTELMRDLDLEEARATVALAPED